MKKRQLDSLLVRAFDGCQTAGREGNYAISDDLLAGVWWTLFTVRRALDDHPVAIKALQELGNGNVDLNGMRNFIAKRNS